MANPYLAVLRTPGSVSFALSGAVARLPIAMVGLGIVLLVSIERDSYALAGALSATEALVNAVAMPLTSRYSDRYGQSRVLPILITVNVVSLLLMAYAVLAGASAPILFALALVGGASIPPVGSMTRARWSYVLKDPDRLHTAFALESVLDEAVFVIGPPLATALALAWSPGALIAACGFLGLGGLYLSSLRDTEPPPAPPASHGGRSALREPGLILLVLVFLFLGAIFGSFDVNTVAFAESKGSPGAAGLILGLYAFGSLVAGLWVGTLPSAEWVHRRLLLALVALACVTAPILFVSSTPLMCAAAFVAGVAISPVLISGFSLVERLVPSAKLTEGLAIATSGLAAGFALGSAVAGWLVDNEGANSGYGFTAACGAAAMVLGLIFRPALARAEAAGIAG